MSALRRFALGVIPFLFLLTGLTCLRDFGEGWDEHYSYQRGEQTYAFVRDCVAKRGLGDHEGLLQLKKALYHPSFFATANYVVTRLSRRYFALDAVAAHHLLPLLVAAAGLLVFGLLIQMLSDRLTACLSQLFLALYTPFLAHAQFNDKDIPGMMAALTALYFFCQFRRDGALRYSILAGLFIGLGASTNLNSLLIVPIILVGLVLERGFSRQSVPMFMPGARRLMIGILLLMTTAILTIYASWPLLWIYPRVLYQSAGYFSSIFWKHRVLYFGTLYPGSKLPWHYTPVSLFMATPIITFICAMAGIVLGLRAAGQRCLSSAHAIAFSLLLVPLLSRMLPGIVRYHGMRHIFIAVPALAVLAGIGLSAFLRWGPMARSHPTVRALPVALVTLLLIRQGEHVHPYEAAYFNEVVQVICHHDLDRYFEVDPYDDSYKEGLEWVNRHAQDGDRICLPVIQQVEPLFAASFSIRPDLELNSDGAVYAIVTSHDARRYPKVINARFMETYEPAPIFNVRRYHTTLLSVYERRGHTTQTHATSLVTP